MQGNYHEVERIQILCSVFILVWFGWVFLKLVQKCLILVVTDLKVLEHLNVHASRNI